MTNDSNKDVVKKEVTVYGPDKSGIMAAHDNHLPIVLASTEGRFDVVITQIIDHEDNSTMTISGIMTGPKNGRCRIAYKYNKQMGSLEQIS